MEEGHDKVDSAGCGVWESKGEVEGGLDKVDSEGCGVWESKGVG